MSIRPVKRVTASKPTMEGAGVRLRRAFGFGDTSEFDPFLLFDDFRGDSPQDYLAGFPWHPHRGIETITYVIEGEVEHGDSMGNAGIIGPGDVQWMTAASGLIHDEYHSDEFARQGGPFEMVQLWVNLPAKDKMAVPGYQGLTADQIPIVALPQEAGTARIIAGRYGDMRGPARTFTPMNVWDLRLMAGRSLSIDLPAGHTTALFVLHGSIQMGAHTVRAAELAVMEREGTQLACDIPEDAMVLLLNGEPLNEPIVGHGPFVMNTRQEISQAIHDYNSGKFGRMVQ
jgi:hypothetical protein